MILLTVSDFVTWFSIPVSVAQETEADLQTCIDRFEKSYIVKLLGATLGELFIADLANVSQEARFAAIEDQFYLDDTSLCGRQYHSTGMVDMLKGFVFYEFVSINAAKLSQNGVTVSIDEAGTILGMENVYRFAEKKFNDALITYDAIQWYINHYAPQETSYTYPEYNGAFLSPRYSAFL